MPKYEVKSPIKHDGDLYEIGEPIELTTKAAKPLIDLGAIAPAAPAAEEEEVRRQADKSKK